MSPPRYSATFRAQAVRDAAGATSYAEVAQVAQQHGVATPTLLAWLTQDAPACPYLQSQTARRIVHETQCAAPGCVADVDNPPLCPIHRRAFRAGWAKLAKSNFRFTTRGNFEWTFAAAAAGDRVPVLFDDVAGMVMRRRYGRALLVHTAATGPEAAISLDADLGLYVLEVPADFQIDSWPRCHVTMTRRQLALASVTD